MELQPPGTVKAAESTGLLELAAALGDDQALSSQLEQVALAAVRLTGTDHADLTVFSPSLRRFIPARNPRVFMHQGDEDAAARIREERAPLLVARAADAVTETDLTLFNRDIASYLGVPVLIGGKAEAALLVFSREPRAFDGGEPERLGVLAGLAGLAIERHRLRLEASGTRRLLRRLGLVDPETGAAAASQYRLLLEREWHCATEAGLPLAVLLVDVQLRDGTPATGRAFAGVVEALRCALYRPGDILARLDGQRLALLLPETDTRGALAFARRLRRDLNSPGPGGRQDVSLHIGISAFDTLRLPHLPPLGPDDLHRRAEEALAEAALAGSGSRVHALELA